MNECLRHAFGKEKATDMHHVKIYPWQSLDSISIYLCWELFVGLLIILTKQYSKNRGFTEITVMNIRLKSEWIYVPLVILKKKCPPKAKAIFDLLGERYMIWSRSSWIICVLLVVRIMTEQGSYVPLGMLVHLCASLPRRLRWN